MARRERVLPLKPTVPSPDSEAGGIAVFTGAFDPVTLGHIDIIRRGVLIFRELIVGVGINPEKKSLFSPEERVQLLRASVQGIPRVRVEMFQGLTVHFVQAQGAHVILRGARSVADMDYELTMARTNRIIAPHIETVFLTASEQYSHLSSTLIRQIAQGTGKRELARFVPRPVIRPLLEKCHTSTG